MVTYLRIDGVAMPAPRSYKIIRSDLDSEKTTRSEAGYLKRDRVRGDVYKIECEWLLKEPKLRTLCNALSPKAINVQFYDGTTGTYGTCKMYAGDRQSELVIPDDNINENWWSFSCNLIAY